MDTEKRSRMGTWKNKTSLERKLIILMATILVLGSIAITVFMIINTDKFCRTPSCIHAAAEILSYIDSTQDPCDDFYKFTCGTFLKTTYGNKDVEPMQQIAITSEHQYKTVYEQPIFPMERRIFKAQKRLYQSCMNETAIDEDGLDPIKQVFRKIGGWPVLEGRNWDDKHFDWKEATFILKDLGFFHEQFISFSVSTDKNDTTNNILEIREPLILSSSKDEKVFEDYVVDVAVIFGAERSRATYELTRMFELRQYLKKIVNDTNFLRNNGSLPYNRTTIAKVQTIGFISWWDFVNSIIYPNGYLDEDAEVIFSIQKYISSLDLLFKRFSKRAQANYIIWTVIEQSISYLPREIKERHGNFTKLIGKKEINDPRFRFCAELATNRFPYSGDVIRTEAYSSPKKKNEIHSLVNNIKLELDKMITTFNWMNENNKKYAKEKVLNISPLQNCPEDFFLEDAAVYDQLESENFLLQFATTQIIRHNFKYRGLHLLANRTKFWNYCNGAKHVNAFYLPNFNKIMLPDLLAQQFFFDANGPQYKNYGALGTIIGHELSHAFSKKVATFGKYGEKKDWWSNSTYQGYEKATECIIEQYSSFKIDGIDCKMNGTATLSENLADLAGKKAVYFAYLTWIGRNGNEKKLPGLDYDSKQLFWISSAMHYCAQPDYKTCSERYGRPEFRAVGPLRNIEDFGRDFGCPVGANMNPPEKCDMY